MTFTTKENPSYSVTIWIGHPIAWIGVPWISHVTDVLREYCSICITKDSDHPLGLCVTVCQTTFIHKDGVESGFKIGLVNYPRFPKTYEQILDHADRIAKLLIKKLDQKTALIDAPDRTIWIKREEDEMQQPTL